MVNNLEINEQFCVLRWACASNSTNHHSLCSVDIGWARKLKSHRYEIWICPPQLAPTSSCAPRWGPTSLKFHKGLDVTRFLLGSPRVRGPTEDSPILWVLHSVAVLWVLHSVAIYLVKLRQFHVILKRLNMKVHVYNPSRKCDGCCPLFLARWNDPNHAVAPILPSRLMKSKKQW